MNRLILIGNGFDLAHGLKTSYKDFIENFWEEKADKFINAFINEEEQSKKTGTQNNYFNPEDEVFSFFELHYIPKDIPKEILEKKGQEKMNSFLVFVGANQINYQFKNQFLRQITQNLTLKNWVDIEIEYYKALQECITGGRSILQLNREFLFVKNELIKYLKSEIAKEKPSLESINNLIDSFITIDNIDFGSYTPSKNDTLFLNFNYTNTEKQYVDNLKKGTTGQVKSIHIHGQLDDPDNPIVFGYDDNTDEKQKILISYDKEYLKNIKSFFYKNNNYNDQLQSFIDLGKFEILILGHSCGISDKTILKQLFEHDNCDNIRIYYHKYNNKDIDFSDENDDYSDKIKNISIIFNEITPNRKIISKNECEPLSNISKLLSNPDST